MSDFPGAMTKQILSAPPATIRSIRYSLTAHGRSVTPSLRLPTGRSSFEKARGWMRLPRPAAGTNPHMSALPVRPAGRLRADERVCAGSPPAGRPVGEDRLQLGGAPLRRVVGEDPRAGALADPRQLGVRPLDDGHRVLRRGCGQDLLPRLKEVVEPR